MKTVETLQNEGLSLRELQRKLRGGPRLHPDVMRDMLPKGNGGTEIADSYARAYAASSASRAPDPNDMIELKTLASALLAENGSLYREPAPEKPDMSNAATSVVLVVQNGDTEVALTPEVITPEDANAPQAYTESGATRNERGRIVPLGTRVPDRAVSFVQRVLAGVSLAALLGSAGYVTRITVQDLKDRRHEAGGKTAISGRIGQGSFEIIGNGSSSVYVPPAADMTKVYAGSDGSMVYIGSDEASGPAEDEEKKADATQKTPKAKSAVPASSVAVTTKQPATTPDADARPSPLKPKATNPELSGTRPHNLSAAAPMFEPLQAPQAAPVNSPIPQDELPLLLRSPQPAAEAGINSLLPDILQPVIPALPPLTAAPTTEPPAEAKPEVKQTPVASLESPKTDAIKADRSDAGRPSWLATLRAEKPSRSHTSYEGLNGRDSGLLSLGLSDATPSLESAPQKAATYADGSLSLGIDENPHTTGPLASTMSAKAPSESVEAPKYYAGSNLQSLGLSNHDQGTLQTQSKPSFAERAKRSFGSFFGRG